MTIDRGRRFSIKHAVTEMDDYPLITEEFPMVIMMFCTFSNFDDQVSLTDQLQFIGLVYQVFDNLVKEEGLYKVRISVNCCGRGRHMYFLHIKRCARLFFANIFAVKVALTHVLRSTIVIARGDGLAG